MLAIGIYHNRLNNIYYTHSLFVAYIDPPLVCDLFLKKFGADPIRVVILQNGQRDPKVVVEFDSPIRFTTETYCVEGDDPDPKPIDRVADSIEEIVGCPSIQPSLDKE
jgi:hypothetical protein